MPKKKTVWLFFGVGVAFITAMMAGFWSGVYWIPAIPLALFLLWAMFRYPHLFFFLIVLSVPVSIPVDDVGMGLGMSFPSEPMIILFFMGLVLYLLMGKKLSPWVFQEPVTWVILALLGWMGLSTLGSSMPITSLKFFLSTLWYVGVFYFGSTLIFKSTRPILVFLWLMVFSSTILIVYTLINHSEGSFSRLYAYTAMRPFLPDHGMYAAAIAVFIPVLASFVFSGHHFGLPLWLRGIGLTLLFLFSGGVIASFTRASWISLALAGGFLFLLFLGLKFRHLILLFCLAALTIFYFRGDILIKLSQNRQGSADDIGKHLSSVSNVKTDPSNLERLNRWGCAFRMVEERPILGWGPGTFGFQYAPFQVSYEKTIISTNAGDRGNVHSEFLRPLSEQGYMGFILYLALILAALNLGIDIFRRASSPGIKYLSVGVFLGLFTYMAHGLLNNYSDYDKLAVPFWGFLSVLVCLKHLSLSGGDLKT